MSLGKPVREMLVGLPDHREPADIYRTHQQVWTAMDGMVPDARSRQTQQVGAGFLFARLRGGICIVRSRHLRGPMTRVVATPISGARHRLQVDLVAMQGQEHDEPVPSSNLDAWCARTLSGAGLEVVSVPQLTTAWHRGSKRDRLTGRTHAIALHTVTVKADVQVVDATAATAAFVDGVGRGRRFGFGMLRLS